MTSRQDSRPTAPPAETSVHRYEITDYVTVNNGFDYIKVRHCIAIAESGFRQELLSRDALIGEMIQAFAGTYERRDGQLVATFADAEQASGCRKALLKHHHVDAQSLGRQLVIPLPLN